MIVASDTFLCCSFKFEDKVPVHRKFTMRSTAIIALIYGLLVKAKCKHLGRVRLLDSPVPAGSLRGKPVSKSQSDALYRIFVAMKMDADKNRPLPVHNWFLDDTNSYNRDYCNFTGVTCDSAGFVTALDLLDETMSGTLPDAFSELSELKRLRLFNSSLHGTIPDSLLNMANLTNLNLGHNHLSGTFPNFSGLSSLTRLILDRNAFSG
jgi:Leucine-rich repeat (LRR) protein